MPSKRLIRYIPEGSCMVLVEVLCILGFDLCKPMACIIELEGHAGSTTIC